VQLGLDSGLDREHKQRSARIAPLSPLPLEDPILWNAPVTSTLGAPLETSEPHPTTRVTITIPKTPLAPSAIGDRPSDLELMTTPTQVE
jgi:hypothetical protein